MSLNPAEIQAQRDAQRAQRATLFARPTPSAGNVALSSATQRTLTAGATVTTTRPATTATQPVATTPSQSVAIVTTTATPTQSTTATSAISITTPASAATTSTISSDLTTTSTLPGDVFTPQVITVLSPSSSLQNPQQQQQQQQPHSNPNMNPREETWQELFDQWVHNAIRHALRITTDTDIIANSLVDAKVSANCTVLSNNNNNDNNINVKSLPYSLSNLTGQAQDQVVLEQKAGYTYLPLVSKLILGEYVSQGLSRNCICEGNNNNHPQKPQQECQQCQQSQPFFKVSHLESIFAEMNSLMVGYQPIPSELIQSKTLLQKPPTMDDAVSTISNIIANNGQADDVYSTAYTRAIGSISKCNDNDNVSNVNEHTMPYMDKNDRSNRSFNSEDSQILAALLDSPLSSPTSPSSLPTFNPVPLTDLSLNQPGMGPITTPSTSTTPKISPPPNKKGSITYQQQSAMLIGALAAQALTNQLPLRKISRHYSQNSTHLSPLLANESPSVSSSDHTNTLSSDASGDQISPQQPTGTKTRMDAISSLIARIQLLPALSLSSPLSTLAHLGYNSHNTTLRSKSLLYWYIQSYHRIQTLYEYVSTLGSLNTLNGINIYEVVQKLNKMLDVEIADLNRQLQANQTDDGSDKYQRSAGINMFANSNHPLKSKIDKLIMKKIELNKINAPAQGTAGDLVHLVNQLSNKMGNDLNANGKHTITFDTNTAQNKVQNDFSSLAGQTFTGMDPLSNNVLKLLQVDTQGVNLSTILSTSAQKNLLVAADFTLDANNNSATVPPITSLTASTPTESMSMAFKNLEQTIGMGYHPNTLYSPLVHPGLYIQDQFTCGNPVRNSPNNHYFNPSKPVSINATGQTTYNIPQINAPINANVPGNNKIGKDGKDAPVLFTLNQDSSDALFTSLICPQIQPLLAAIVGSVIPNDGIIAKKYGGVNGIDDWVKVSQQPNNNHAMILESINPIPIFAHLHAKMSTNGLINVSTAKGFVQIPMVMMVNTLLHSLSTISHRILSAVGSLLLEESDLVLNIIHDHFKTVHTTHRKKQLAAALKQTQSNQQARRPVTVGAMNDNDKIGVSNDETPGAVDFDQTKVECMQLLVEKTPNTALYIQLLQAGQIKHQYHTTTFSYNPAVVVTISQFVQGQLTGSTQTQQFIQQQTLNHNKQLTLQSTLKNGKKVSHLFTPHPFAMISSQAHDWNQVLGIMTGYGFYKTHIIQSLPPFSFANYYKMTLTRQLPQLSSTVSMFQPTSPTSQSLSASTDKVTTPINQYYPILSPSQRLPQPSQPHSSPIHFNHTLRRQWNPSLYSNPNNWTQTNNIGAMINNTGMNLPPSEHYINFTDQQRTAINDYPRVSAGLIGFTDEIENDSLVKSLNPSISITIAQRNSFQQQLFLQNYRNTHIAAVYTHYASELIGTESFPPAMSHTATMTTTTTTTIPGNNKSNTNLILYGCPIHITPLPTGFSQGLSAVMEGGLHKVNGVNFDTNFLLSLYSVNTSPQVQVDNITYPMSRSKYGKGNELMLLQKQKLISSTTLSNALSASSTTTIPLTSTPTPLSTINIKGLTTGGKDNTQHALLLKQSGHINSFIKMYQSYHGSLSSSPSQTAGKASSSNMEKNLIVAGSGTQTTNNDERGSVVLATLLYPIMSYFILTLMYSDTIRDLLTNKSNLPLDLIDGNDLYEVVYKNWVTFAPNGPFFTPDHFNFDRNLYSTLLTARKQLTSSNGIKPLNNYPSIKNVAHQQQLHHSIHNKNVSQSTLQSSLLNLGVRGSALSLALHEMESQQSSLMLTCIHSTQTNQSNDLNTTGGKGGNTSNLSEMSSKLSIGGHVRGYDSNFLPNFITCGLNCIESLSKSSHESIIGGTLNKTRGDTNINTFGGRAALGLLNTLSQHQQSLVLDPWSSSLTSTPVADISLFLIEPSTPSSTANIVSSMNSVVNVITSTGDDITENAGLKQFYLPYLTPQSLTTSQFPIFPTLRPTSLAYSTTILRGFMSLCLTPSTISILLAHPGFAPMFNAIATPQRQISHRILQWVHLKQIIDLSRIQANITTPLFHATTPPSNITVGSCPSQQTNHHQHENNPSGSSIPQLGALGGFDGTIVTAASTFGLDSCPQPSQYSPSVSPRFDSQGDQGFNDDNDDFAPLLSLTSLLSIPSAIRAKLGSIDLPKPHMSFGDLFGSKPNKSTITSTTTTASSSSSATKTEHTPTTSTKKGLSSSTTLQHKPSHLSKLQQYNGLSLLDAILPFFSKSQVQYTPSVPYPISISNSMKLPKQFASSSLFGLFFNICPANADPAFQNFGKRHYTKVNNTFARFRTALGEYSSQLELFNESILRTDPLTRRRWVDYHSQYALKALEYRKMSPKTDNIAQPGAMVNFAATLLSHVQSVTRHPTQPVHLNLQHALQEIGFNSSNVDITRLFHQLDLNSLRATPTSLLSQQLLTNLSTALDASSKYPGRIELDYLLRYDDSNPAFKLKLPPHIFFHVLKHFAPISLDDIRRSMSPQNYQSRFTTMSPQQHQQRQHFGNSVPLQQSQQQHSSQSDEKKGTSFLKKNRLVSLIASSAAGITDMARGLIASHDDAANSDGNYEDADDYKDNNNNGDDGDTTMNDDSDHDLTHQQNSAQSYTQEQSQRQQLTTKQHQAATGYLSMLYRQVNELLTVLSFFVENLCDCPSSALPTTTTLYSPTPCHSRKALQSLNQCPWIVPQPTPQYGSNGSLNDGFNSAGLVHSIDILGDIIHQYQLEQQFMKESSLLSSLSNDSLLQSSRNSHLLSNFSNNGSKSSPFVIEGGNNTPHGTPHRRKQQRPGSSLQPRPGSSQQPLPKFELSTALDGRNPINDFNIPTDPTSLLLNPQLLKNLMPSKFMFKFTDICSQCGLLLRTTSTTAATSTTLNALRQLQSRLYEVLNPREGSSNIGNEDNSKNKLLDFGSTSTHTPLISTSTSPLSNNHSSSLQLHSNKIQLISPPSLLAVKPLALSPVEQNKAIIASMIGPEAFQAAQEHGFWILAPSDKNDTKKQSHLFNVYIFANDEDEVESEENAEFIEGLTELDKITCSESEQVITYNGIEVQVPFTTYFIPSTVILQGIINSKLAHLVSFGVEDVSYHDNNPFKLTSSADNDPSTHMGDHDLKLSPQSSSSSSTSDHGDDHNPECYPVVFTHSVDSLGDMNESGFEIDPQVVTGLIAAFCQSHFSLQQSTFKHFSCSLDPSTLSTLSNNDLTNKDKIGSDAKDDHKNKKNSENEEVDGEDDDDDDSGKSNKVNKIALKPGSQYLHCEGIPPYPPSPTKYIRYFDLERLFYHSANEVNNVRQQIADKLFVFCAQKSHDLTLLQINSFLNRQYTQQQHRVNQVHAMVLSDDDKNQLYDNLYGYNLMLHLSQHFSEASLIKALDSKSISVEEFTPLPSNMDDTATKTTMRVDKNNNKKSIYDHIDPLELQQALAIANQSIGSSLYGFRTELLCVTLEALHLTVPSAVRSFETSQENMQRYDESINQMKTQLADYTKKRDDISAMLSNPPGTLDFQTKFKYNNILGQLNNAVLQLTAQIEMLEKEKQSIYVNFGKSKMFISDPAFISKVLSTYNWVCGLIMSCMNSSCIYCRDGVVNSSHDDHTDDVDEGEEDNDGENSFNSNSTIDSNIDNDTLIGPENHIKATQTNTNPEESVLIRLLARTFTCSCPKTMIGVIPEYWIQDAWSLMNILHKINDTTLRIACQTNSLDNLLSLAISTVGTVSGGGRKGNQSSLKTASEFNVINPITQLTNPFNVSPDKVKTFESIVAIIQRNKLSNANDRVNDDNVDDDEVENEKNLSDDNNYDQSGPAKSVLMSLSKIRSKFEENSEILYDNLEEDISFVNQNFSSFTVSPLLNTDIDFQFDPNIVQLQKDDYSTINQQIDQGKNGYITLLQYTSNHISNISHKMGDFIIASSSTTTTPSPLDKTVNNNGVEIRYTNHLSPLYVLLASHLSNFAHTTHSHQQSFVPNSTTTISSHVLDLYPYIEGSLLAIYSSNHAPLNTRQPTQQPFTHNNNSISLIKTTRHLKFTHSLPPPPPPTIRNSLRGPLQIYLIGVLTAFLPKNENEKQAKITQEYFENLPKVIERSQISKNMIPMTRQLLSQWPYNRNQPNNSTVLYPAPVNGMEDNEPHYPPQPDNHPTDPLTTILLAQSNQIPLTADGKTLPIKDPQGFFDRYQGKLPILSTTSFPQYHSNRLRQLAKDKEGHISPSGISWWPMRYIHLDTAVHPIWRTGRQSTDLMTLLMHLYASTATTDTVEVTSEEDRALVWTAQNEKYNNKNALVEFMNTILLTEAEEDAQSQSIQLQGVIQQLGPVPGSNDTSVPPNIDQQSYLIQVNQNILQYENYRQNTLRLKVILHLSKTIQSEHQKNNPLSKPLTQNAIINKIATMIIPNNNNSSQSPSSRFLPSVTRLSNGNCSCGCTCAGCGCGYDYHTYSNISVPQEFRSLHIPPPPTTCICGQHTKSLTKLAIGTSFTSSNNFVVLNEAISTVSKPLSHQTAMRVALQNLLVTEYNEKLAQELAVPPTSSSDHIDSDDDEAMLAQAMALSICDDAILLDDSGATTSAPPAEPLKPLHVDGIELQFPLFDRFLHVLSNDISYFMDEVIRSLKTLKEREVKGITVTEADVDQWEQRQAAQNNNNTNNNNNNNQNTNPNNTNVDAAVEGGSTRPVTDSTLKSNAYWYNRFSTTTLLLLSVMCARGKTALLRPEFAARIAIIIGGSLHSLTNPQESKLIAVSKELRIDIDFSPKDIIALLLNILGHLTNVPSTLNIPQLTNRLFQVTHPLAYPTQVLSLTNGTPSGIITDDTTGRIVDNEVLSKMKMIDEFKNETNITDGGLTLLKSLVHKDAKFKTADFQRAVSILLRSGLQNNSALENDILSKPQAVIFAATRGDKIKHGNALESVKTHHYTTPTFTITSSSQQQQQQQSQSQPSLVVYGNQPDDRARAIARCQSRAVAVLLMYTRLNGLRGYNDKKLRVPDMLKNQNQCSTINSWTWMYSNPQALTLAKALYDYGQEKNKTFDAGDDANTCVNELGLPWWPLPPPTTPVYVSLINALKGEHEWDEYLTPQHFAANISTLETLYPCYRIDDTSSSQYDQIVKSTTEQLLCTPDWLEKNHGALQLPSYTWYARPHTAISEFWLSRITLLFNVCNAVLSRDERLLGSKDFTEDDATTLVETNSSATTNDPFSSWLDDEYDPPEEFIDDCFADIMPSPIQLTQSKGKMEWLALYRVLLSTQQDPFTRDPVQVNDIVPLPHIKFAVKLFKLRRGILE